MAKGNTRTIFREVYMSIPQITRDRLLVEASHRCTICIEKCFEIHHIVEQAEGGTDDECNLIVMCPNCHQQRYHRNHEFSRDQLLLYKAQLKENRDVEHRLLMNLEDIRLQIGKTATDELLCHLSEELNHSALLVDSTIRPDIHRAITETANVLAEKNELSKGARAAIELKYELERQRSKAQHHEIQIVDIDNEAWKKNNQFPSAYQFVLKLNEIPNQDWGNIFAIQYKQEFYMMKRETELYGDCIIMIVSDKDNLQGHIGFAKQLVARTNRAIFEEGFAYIDRQIDAEKRKALEEYDAIQLLKNKTKNLTI